MSTGKSGLVVTAHPGDFVWRAGGAIALHARKGYRMVIVCLSYGERGESQWAWKKADVAMADVKAQRKDEAERAAAMLGAEIVFFDAGDYPLRTTPEMLDRLVDIYREVKPSFVLTHSLEDPYNVDHPEATRFAQEARIIAQAAGHKPSPDLAYSAPPVFLFEPHQPEQCGWKPDVLLDITAVWAKKRAAIECMAGQEHLWEYYTRVGQQRGAQAARNSDRKVVWGEGYQAVFPHVVERLG